MANSFAQGYALLIGVNENCVPDWALPDVAKDIAALQGVLVQPGRCAYPPEQVKTLSGAEASRDHILQGLEWLKGRLAADASGSATAVIYYSGHGWRDTTQDPPGYYLIPYDGVESRLRYTALRAADFAAEIEALQPRRLLVILDCCHAGGMGLKDLPGGGLAAGAVPLADSAAFPPALLMGRESPVLISGGAKGLERLAEGAGRAVLSSSQGEGASYIRRDKTMSLFTYHLIEALTGHAAPQAGAGEVLVSDIMGHVYRRVPQSALAEWGQVQQPDYQVSGNFPVALLLGGKGLAQGAAAPDPLRDLAGPGAAAGRVIHTGDIQAGPGSEVNIAGGDIHQTNITTGGGAYIGKVEASSFVGGDQTVYHEDRHVEIKAPMSGGMIVTGNQNRINLGTAPEMEDWLALLRDLQTALAGLPLPEEELMELDEDLNKAAAQAGRPEPNRGIILKRLGGVAGFLASGSSARVRTGAPHLIQMAEQALEWAGQLFR